jgi:hypothetical protein
MRTFWTVVLSAVLTSVCIHPAAAATVVCVNAGDAADFQTQLDNAVASGVATTLEVPRGTYHLGGNQLVFNATSMSQGQLDISGGYNSDCSTNIDNPALTIIDGDNLSGVLSITSTGGISVRYLTIQNGLKADNPGLVVSASGGGIIIDYNIIQNNRASDERAGLDVTISGSGDVHVDGNLIAANSANTNVCGGEIDNDSTGTTYLTNNTIADNVISGPLLRGDGGLAVFGTAFASNNIFWGNTSLDFDANGATLVNNDYGTLGGTPGGNTGSQSVDPQFVGSANFQLAATSPLLAQGTTSPAGGLPTIDLLGHDREYNALTATVDMGAYERGDEIFADGLGD